MYISFKSNLLQWGDGVTEKFQGCCPSTWKPFGSHCYLISPEQNFWTENEQNCVGMGAHLVVINTKAEQIEVLLSAFLVRSTKEWQLAMDWSDTLQGKCQKYTLGGKYKSIWSFQTLDNKRVNTQWGKKNLKIDVSTSLFSILKRQTKLWLTFKNTNWWLLSFWRLNVMIWRGEMV